MEAERLNQMLKLQHELNTIIDKDWRERDRPWYRAAYIELVEAIEHHNSWKWWKSHDPDFEQAFMEVIDTIHFAMSQRDTPFDAPIENYGEDSLGFVKTCEFVIKDLVNDRQIYDYIMLDLFELAHILGYTEEDIYRTYVAKNLLNIFRQQNGYKDGSYIKDWNGEEDNVILARIMATTDDVEKIREDLQEFYKGVKK